MNVTASTRRRSIRIAMAALLATGATAVSLAVALPASAAVICDQFGTINAGNYVIMNNRWGTSATQCINTSTNGFTITQQDGIGNTSGAPTAYPAIYLGCHYTRCSPSTALPRQISTIGSAPNSISVSFPSSGTWNSAYDIWLNANNDVSGVQDTEIMIWLNRQGSIQPIGSATGTVNLAGRSWQVWTGNNGQNNVVSYLFQGSPLTSFSFDAMVFIRDTLSRGSQYGTNSWWLTSVQAGFEPWIGGVGLTVNSFSSAVNSGTQPPTSTTRPPSTTTRPPSTTTTRPPTGQPGTCTATYRTTGSWQGGLQAEVTVRNNGSSTLNGWTVPMTLPGGQTIQNLWNGVNSGTSGSITVRNAPYNGSIGPNGSTTFGYVVMGSSTAAPSVGCTSP
jgi:hypothetical protein